MPYTLTAEQQDIISTSIEMYNNPTDLHLLKVSAVAGALCFINNATAIIIKTKEIYVNA